MVIRDAPLWQRGGLSLSPVVQEAAAALLVLSARVTALQVGVRWSEIDCHYQAGM
jgi:hypothetical protein